MNPSYLRRSNQRLIVETVLRLRTASRAQLTRISGISSPTVSRIVDDLLSTGILMETDDAEAPDASLVPTALYRETPKSVVAASVGRPSAPLALNNRKQRFLALQIGVTTTRLTRTPIALPDHDVWELTFPTPTTASEWSVQLARCTARLPVNDLEAVIVSVPGVIDESTGRVILSPNLRWAESTDLRQAIERVVACNMNVLFVQETRALALGHLAASADAGDFFLIDFGTGVGGAAIIGGALFAGALPLSGEIGHTPVIGNTRLCGCGSVGCLETLLSRRGLLKTARENDNVEVWQDVIERVTQNGIPDWLKRTLDAAAVCMAASLNVLGLRQVVVTGCICDFPPSVIDYLANAIRADAMWARFGTVELHTAPRRRLAGMVHSAIGRTLLQADGR
ncbi:MAG: ROK family protein [Tepidisphaeraceae bacterium]